MSGCGKLLLAGAAGVIMDDRDVGTVLFPAAHVKLFVTADVRVRPDAEQPRVRQAAVLISVKAMTTAKE